MNKTKYILLAAIFPLITLSNTVSAVPVTVLNSSNQLIGINGISLLGDTWDVAFVEGKFNDIFSNGSTLDFTDGISAIRAAAELASVFDSAPFLPFDQDPTLIFGVENAVAAIMTPYQVLTPTLANTARTINRPFPGDADAFQSGVSVSRSLDTHTDALLVYADWTVATVPVPAAVWLMSTGLLSLIGFKKLKLSTENV